MNSNLLFNFRINCSPPLSSLPNFIPYFLLSPMHMPTLGNEMNQGRFYARFDEGKERLESEDWVVVFQTQSVREMRRLNGGGKWRKSEVGWWLCLWLVHLVVG